MGTVRRSTRRIALTTIVVLGVVGVLGASGSVEHADASLSPSGPVWKTGPLVQVLELRDHRGRTGWVVDLFPKTDSRYEVANLNTGFRSPCPDVQECQVLASIGLAQGDRALKASAQRSR
jgi:hypothetical protein